MLETYFHILYNKLVVDCGGSVPAEFQEATQAPEAIWACSHEHWRFRAWAENRLFHLQNGELSGKNRQDGGFRSHTARMPLDSDPSGMKLLPILLVKSDLETVLKRQCSWEHAHMASDACVAS